MTIVSAVLTTALGLVFLVAAVGKLQHPKAFMSAVRNYEIVPARIAPLSALALIGAECFLAVAFLTGWLIDLAVPLAAVTILIFVGAVGVNLRRHRSVPCGCFGNPDESISTATLARLIVLLMGVATLSVAATFSSPTATIVITTARNAQHGLEVGAIAAALTLSAMWILKVPQLISVIRVR